MSKQDFKNDENWWKFALPFFYQISGWIVGPIILALIIGNYIDDIYKSKPKYLIISVLIAFIISNIGLVLQVKKYLKSLKKDQNNK